MRRRPVPEGLSPRALARLRASPRSYVPTEHELVGRGWSLAGDDVGAVLGGSSGGEAVSTGAGLVGDGDADRRAFVGEGGEGRRAPVRDDDRRSPVADRGDDRLGLVGDGEDHRRVPVGDDDHWVPGGGRHARAPHPPRWVRLPAAFVGARWQPGRAAVLGVLLVVVLAAAVFGLRVAWAQSDGGGTVIAPGGGSRAGPTGVSAGAVPVGVGESVGPPSGSATASASGPPQGAKPSPGASGGVVVVHVVGRVRHPGVRRLALGSRVADAVAAAGGASARADVSALNLARLLVDGEQVRVPAVGEPVVPAPGPAPGGGGGAGGAGGVGGSSGSATPVSINTADLAALDTLPGVGPVLAQRILDWRTAHGRFTSVDELGEVSGIGEKLLAQLGPLVTL